MSQPSPEARAAKLATHGLAWEGGLLVPFAHPEIFSIADATFYSRRRFTCAQVALFVRAGLDGYRGPIAAIARAHGLTAPALRAACRQEAKRAGLGFALKKGRRA